MSELRGVKNVARIIPNEIVPKRPGIGGPGKKDEQTEAEHPSAINE